ncbi:DoxX family membrane protein [Alloacidobacterium sp.]|uniref:DoxX family membrane protein n=1 Tax=Alloacidobacterium sp. TaxID=2951999 RepID=UPI002D6DB64F|nr:DoxX family membrane protein [Alloacidobacterium sp.]HYK36436.1 DoxX family membrane protein [Alloacidobacterium sp.]
MKIAALVARIIMGLIFIIFGLNGFLNFIKGPLPPGLAGQFVGALIQSHYVWVVAAAQIIGGALVLIGRYVPLGLAILAPVIVNILAFHALLMPAGAQMAILVTICWIIAFIPVRQHFSSLFVQKT